MIQKTSSKLPEQFKLLVDTRKTTVNQAIKTEIEVLLSEVTQPLSIIEIGEGLVRLTDRRVDKAYVRKVVYELVAEGKVSRRLETQEERNLRAGGKAPRGYCATLFSIGHKVPTRVEVQALEGVILDSSGKYGHQGRRRKKNFRPASKAVRPVTVQRPGLVETPNALTDVIVKLIKDVINQGDFDQRIQRLEDTLKRMSEITKF